MRSRSSLGVLVAAAWLAGTTTAWAQGAPAQPPATAQGQRIGVIDLGRILARSAAGVAAREQLEREKGTMEREMETRRQDLEKLREELEKKGTLMTADARRDKEDQLERKRRDATRLADDFQRELSRKEQQLAQGVLRDIAGLVERVGKQRGFFLIVERRGAGVLYNAAEADVTDEIIRVYDQESSSKGKK